MSLCGTFGSFAFLNSVLLFFNDDIKKMASCSTNSICRLGFFLVTSKLVIWSNTGCLNYRSSLQQRRTIPFRWVGRMCLSREVSPWLTIAVVFPVCVPFLWVMFGDMSLTHRKKTQDIWQATWDLVKHLGPTETKKRWGISMLTHGPMLM